MRRALQIAHVYGIRVTAVYQQAFEEQGGHEASILYSVVCLSQDQSVSPKDHVWQSRRLPVVLARGDSLRHRSRELRLA